MKGKWAHNERQRVYSGLRKDIEAADLHRDGCFKNTIPASLKSGRGATERRIKVVLEIMKRLKPGDNLACFGLPDVIVKKVNSKSITDTTGVRWGINEFSPVCFY